MFSEKLKISIAQSDETGTFFWHCTKEIYEDDCLKNKQISHVINDRGFHHI